MGKKQNPEAEVLETSTTWIGSYKATSRASVSIYKQPIKLKCDLAQNTLVDRIQTLS